MTKLQKPLMAVILIFCLLFGNLFFAISTSVSTKAPNKVEEKIQTTAAVKTDSWNVTDNILVIKGISMSEYKVGSKYTKSRYANVNGKSKDMFGWQCCGYARYLQQKLYGCHEKNAGSRFKNVSGVVLGKKLTASKIKSIVKSAGVGAHIRTYSYNGTNPHSMVIIGITLGGFTIADANADGKYTIRVKTFTWSEYVSTYGERGLEYVSKYKG